MVACSWLRVVAGWSPVALISSDLAPASSKRFFDIQVTIECGFTLKSVRDMIRIDRQENCLVFVDRIPTRADLQTLRRIVFCIWATWQRREYMVRNRKSILKVLWKIAVSKVLKYTPKFFLEVIVLLPNLQAALLLFNYRKDTATDFMFKIFQYKVLTIIVFQK